MTREHLPNHHVIEDAARLGGGQAEEDTGPGYNAPASLSRFDWPSWILLIMLALGAAAGIWLGVS